MMRWGCPLPVVYIVSTETGQTGWLWETNQRCHTAVTGTLPKLLVILIICANGIITTHSHTNIFHACNTSCVHTNNCTTHVMQVKWSEVKGCGRGLNRPGFMFMTTKFMHVLTFSIIKRALHFNGLRFYTNSLLLQIMKCMWMTNPRIIWKD